MSVDIMVPISVGELFDKISILEIKSERIADRVKLANVNYELQLLKKAAKKLDVGDPQQLAPLFGKLKQVNEQIWDAEDEIRGYDWHGEFDRSFLELAQSIYRLNDERAAIKRELNVLTSSSVFEEKSYPTY